MILPFDRTRGTNYKLKIMENSITSQSYVESMMSALTENQQVEILAKFMGYEKIPPPIEDFICNDYYLGKVFNPNLPNGLYPYWMDILKQVFPNPVICRYPYISLGGKYCASMMQ